MKRRIFLLAGAIFPLLGWQRMAFSQTKQFPIVIGWLNFSSRELNSHLLAAFKEGMAALGWKEGTQLVIEERWADSRIERLQPLAEELAAKKVVLIVSGSSQAVSAAAKAAPTTPIVHASGSDPVAAGFAVSLARPGGLITGVTNVVTDIQEKLVEFAVAIAPRAKRIGFLSDRTNFSRPQLIETSRRASARFSVEPRFAEAGKPEEIAGAIASLARDDVQVVIVMTSPLFASNRGLILKLALPHRWPLITAGPSFVVDGALLSYSAIPSESFRRAAYFADRILKGAKPGDLPFEQPTKLELLINRRTASTLGITIPESLLVRADRVIE